MPISYWWVSSKTGLSGNGVIFNCQKFVTVWVLFVDYTFVLGVKMMLVEVKRVFLVSWANIRYLVNKVSGRDSFWSLRNVSFDSLPTLLYYSVKLKQHGLPAILRLHLPVSSDKKPLSGCLLQDDVRYRGVKSSQMFLISVLLTFSASKASFWYLLWSRQSPALLRLPQLGGA